MNGKKSTEQHLGKPKHKCLHKQVGKNGGDSASQHPKGTHKGDEEHLLRVWSMELQERRVISKKTSFKSFAQGPFIQSPLSSPFQEIYLS